MRSIRSKYRDNASSQVSGMYILFSSLNSNAHTVLYPSFQPQRTGISCCTFIIFMHPSLCTFLSVFINYMTVCEPAYSGYIWGTVHGDIWKSRKWKLETEMGTKTHQSLGVLSSILSLVFHTLVTSWFCINALYMS